MENEFMKEIVANAVYQKYPYAEDHEMVAPKQYYIRYNEKVGGVTRIYSRVLTDGFMEDLRKDFNIDVIFYKDDFTIKENKLERYNGYQSKKYIELQKGYILTFELPSENSSLIDSTVIKRLEKIIINNKLKEKINQKSKIHMVVEDSNRKLQLKPFFIDKYNLDEGLFDLHYGIDFNDFNKILIDKIKNDNKGLVLLHGEPGTGKTFYIRYLLSQISFIKSVVYFPPTMVETITRPDFLDFISEWKDTVILIEDAEPLLVERAGGRNLGITNLLNLTDGILNDLFNIQIVATFNTRLDKLDKALLRPERLIARKEFTKLALDNATRLAEKLLIDKEKIKSDMTLAEIYSLKNESNVIIHEVKEKPKLGFKMN